MSITFFILALATTIAAIALPICGLGWPMAGAGGWEAGRKAFKNVTLGSLATLVVGGTPMMIVGLPDRSQSSRTASASSGYGSEKECGDEASAFVASKDYVKTRLKSPATADFPFLDFQHAEMEDCQMLIRSYVDSQNGFGAMIRSNYDAVLEYKRDRWELVALRIK